MFYLRFRELYCSFVMLYDDLSPRDLSTRNFRGKVVIIMILRPGWNQISKHYTSTIILLQMEYPTVLPVYSVLFMSSHGP